MLRFPSKENIIDFEDDRPLGRVCGLELLESGLFFRPSNEFIVGVAATETSVRGWDVGQRIMHGHRYAQFMEWSVHFAWVEGKRWSISVENSLSVPTSEDI